jgi:hypothetical protein
LLCTRAARDQSRSVSGAAIRVTEYVLCSFVLCALLVVSC